MENTKASPQRFFILCLAILLISLLIHMIFNIREYTSVVAYPYEGIFDEDSITVTRHGSESGASLVPVGITAGVRFYTDGIMVLATDKVTAFDGSICDPSGGKLVSGDVLMKADGADLFNLSQLTQAINSSRDKIVLEVLRDGSFSTVEITPAKSEDGSRKIGCWVRDSTQGIGTITYYNQTDSGFGALGHGIMDVDTQKLMTVRHGQVMESHILDVRKGKKGAPGELIGEIRPECVIGMIKKNTPLGIFGEINQNYPGLPREVFAVARHDQIYQGPAKIFSNIEGGEIKAYDVYIESVNQDANADKGLVVRITDRELVARSGGIVQGMSGSPIVQNGRIVGAITHVFVHNPLRGYGVFIEKMMAAGAN